MKIKSIDTSKDFKLNDAVFKVAMNSQAVYQSVVAEMNNARQGTSSTKNRSLVSGGGKKPFRQKGTGNARQGTSRSPLNRGGGSIFGPNPKYYFKKVNSKTKHLAFKCILSEKVKNEAFKVIESLPSLEKTKEFVSFLNKNDLSGMKVTIVSSEIDEKLALSSRNVPYVSLVKASSCSVRDLYDNDVIIIDVDGLKVLSSRFGDKN
jgi:large subunit ribosomal protein L4